MKIEKHHGNSWGKEGRIDWIEVKSCHNDDVFVCVSEDTDGDRRTDESWIVLTKEQAFDLGCKLQAIAMGISTK